MAKRTNSNATTCPHCGFAPGSDPVEQILDEIAVSTGKPRPTPEELEETRKAEQARWDAYWATTEGEAADELHAAGCELQDAYNTLSQTVGGRLLHIHDGQVGDPIPDLDVSAALARSHAPHSRWCAAINAALRLLDSGDIPST